MAEVTARTAVPCDQPVESTQLNHVAEALRGRDMFDRAQLAWLMSVAYRWGYEARVDEENGAWPPGPIKVAGRWYEQAVEREKADATARLSRPGDYRGGPVEWAEPGDLQVAA